MNYILGKDREQIQIECFDDYIEADSEVKVIDMIVQILDIKSLGFMIGKNDTTGRPMYDPKDLLKLFVYGYFNGIRSSRKLAKQAKINREVIWLIKGIQPKYRVIADFRKDNIKALNNVFESFVDYCIKLGLYGKDLIAVDGTKIEASASKRKHYSKNKLAKMKELAQKKIDEYMHEIEINDAIEDNDELKIEKENLEKAIESLEKKLNEYTEFEKKLEENKINELNLTDTDAKTVKFGAHQGTDVGYNIQAGVDSKNKLIATFEVTNNSADQGQLYNVSNKVKEKFEVESIETLADKGYYSLDDLEKCEKNGIFCYVPKPGYCNSTNNNIYFSDKFKFNPQDNTYTCPEGQVLKCLTKKADAVEKKYANYGVCAKCPHKTECTTAKKGRVITRQEGQEYGDIVDSRAKENKDKYNKRQGIIEHVFGTVKRTMNFTHSLLRGFEKVTGEVSFTFFSYNLKRVINILGIEKFLEYLGTPKILKVA